MIQDCKTLLGTNSTAILSHTKRVENRVAGLFPKLAFSLTDNIWIEECHPQVLAAVNHDLRVVISRVNSLFQQTKKE